MYGTVPLIMATASILIFLMSVSMAIDPDCNYYQNITVGAKYFLYGPSYPNNYPASMSCRWIVKSPQDTNIVFNCKNINLPPSTDCEGHRLSISLTGDKNFRNATNYCGKTTLSGTTESNSLAVGLFVTNYSSGDPLVCDNSYLQALFRINSPTTSVGQNTYDILSPITTVNL